MPTQIKARNNSWLARVVINGKEVDSRIFPPGRKNGPEWLAARNWEVERKKEILKTQNQGNQTLSGFELLLAWGEKYLAHAQKTMTRSTFTEKAAVMRDFFSFCRKRNISGIEQISKAFLIEWLADTSSERGPDRANRYRKNLLAAWHWGMDAVEGFPQDTPLLERIKPFHVESQDRYVPPEEDVIKVLRVANGQDLVMLLTFYYTGARRGEIFRLVWSDVDFNERKIRLVDHKAGSGRKRVRWVPMYPTLVDALLWWREARPCPVENVFMQVQCASSLGQPFTERNKLMPLLCAKAGVRPFGFHALRHKAASIAFTVCGLNAAQQLMGHYRATTTDIYVRSAGLYSDNTVVVNALGENGIGQAASELFAKMPHKAESHGAFCKQEIVNNTLQ